MNYLIWWESLFLLEILDFFYYTEQWSKDLKKTSLKFIWKIRIATVGKILNFKDNTTPYVH